MKKVLLIIASGILFIFSTFALERKSIKVDGLDVWVQQSASEVFEYDSNGKLSHTREEDHDNTEKWYDANGNVLHEKDKFGAEWWYDSSGHLLHFKESNGNESWYEYNSQGKEIHSKKSNGDEIWRKYDKKGSLILTKYSDGRSFSYEYEYDKKGNCTYYKDSSGEEIEIKIDYDKDGNLIHSKSSGGTELWFNASGKKIHSKYVNPYSDYDDNTGSEEFYEYDSKGNLVFNSIKNNASTTEYRYEYDEKGMLVRSYGTDGYLKECDNNGNVTRIRYANHAEDFFEYEFNSNNQIVKKITYEKIFVPGTYIHTTSRLKLRGKDSLDSEVVVIMSSGTLVEPLETGRTENIDGIISPWVKVKVWEKEKDIEGRIIGGAEGWCFGGYLDGIKYSPSNY